MRWLFVPLLFAFACKKETAVPPPDPAPLPPPLSTQRQPLRDALIKYCRPTCPTYDEAEAKMKKRAAAGGYCVRATVGNCAAFRRIEFSSGFDSQEEWFDAKGELVGAKTWVDMQPDGAFYGEVPTCTPMVGPNLCPRAAPPATREGDEDH